MKYYCEECKKTFGEGDVRWLAYDPSDSGVWDLTPLCPECKSAIMGTVEEKAPEQEKTKEGCCCYCQLPVEYCHCGMVA